jgi:putative nucleotidyltransferase with HDIG domain
MLRQIPTDKLRPGMYVDLSSVNWIDHPFLRSGILIEDDSSLSEIRAAGWDNVTIDTEKGADLVDDERIVASVICAPKSVAIVSPDSSTAPTAFHDELVTARGIHARASEIIRQVMADARIGQLSDFNDVSSLADEMILSITRNSSALVSLTSLKTRDDYTFMHCVSVGIFMIGLGRQLGLTGQDLQLLGTAGLLHDVGKAEVPLEVLNKPGALTMDESVLMRAHPTLGYAALVRAGYSVESVLHVVLHHHEKLTGEGYPSGLASDEIPLFTRIASVADVYDAVTSNRVYHSAMPPTAALRMIRKRAGLDFDSTVAQALIKVVGIYPIGSMVRLSSSLLAVVSELNHHNTAKPIVLAFYSIQKEAYIKPERIDLAGSDVVIESDEDPLEWGLDVRRFWHL